MPGKGAALPHAAIGADVIAALLRKESRERGLVGAGPWDELTQELG